MASRTPYSKIAPAGGAYRFALKSGNTITLTANDPLFSMQWTSTVYRCVIQKIKINAICNTAFGSAQLVDYGLYFARSFSVADSGGTAATITGNNGKLDTSFPTTAVADLRIATTGTLTAGTRTLDTQPLLTKAGWFTATAGAYLSDPSVEYAFGNQDATNPITLRAQEGLVLTVLTTMGASGTVAVYVELEWTEVPYGLN